MKTVTMNISLAEELKSFVDNRVKARGYSSHSEYVRDLVRKDELAAAQDTLRALIVQGLESAPGAMLQDVLSDFRMRAKTHKAKQHNAQNG